MSIEEQTEEDFDTAFAENDEPEAEATEQSADEPETMAEESEGTSTEEPPEESPGDEPSEEASGEPEEPDDWKAKYEASEQRMRSWEGRLRAKDRELAELRRQVQSGQEDTGEIDDPDLKQLSADYPDLVGPIWRAARRQAEAAVKPLVEQQATISREQHFAAIRGAHPDYSDIGESPEFKAWVESQPDYAQEAIQRIAAEGTAPEVISLLNTYKEARSARDAVGQSAERNRKRSQQIATATAVKSRRRPVPAGEPDPDDFDAAWDQAT